MNAIGRRRSVVGWLAVALLASTVGCGDDAPAAAGATDGGASTTARLQGSITVAAASSLSKPFDEIADAFEEEHPGVAVTFDYDASSALVDRIRSGAPADVLASADEENMYRMASAGRVDGRPELLARNRLVIVTKPGNPEEVDSLADLATAGTVSLCAEPAPCGKYAAQVLAKARVVISEGSVTRGQNAAATLTAVSEGDAVAGIVYLTDAAAAGDSVATVEIPDQQNVIASYPIAVLKSTMSPDVSTAFVAAVLGPAGQKVLRKYGFLPPA